MPQAQYCDVVNNIRITKGMVTPKKITSTMAWFKGARKVIPEIPEVNNGIWYIVREHVNLDFVKFDLQNTLGEKRHVVIMRRTLEELSK